MSGLSLRARDTVTLETPALLATSLIVMVFIIFLHIFIFIEIIDEKKDLSGIHQATLSLTLPVSFYKNSSLLSSLFYFFPHLLIL